MTSLSFQADREEMLAFLREDLPPDAATKLRARLAEEPALREELAWLREAMEAADAEEISTAMMPTLDPARFLPTPLPVKDPLPTSKRATLGSWLDRQAWIVLPVLLVLLLAQAGGIAWLAAQRNQLAAALHENTLAAIRAQPVPCLSVWVAPLDTASVASLKDWMTLYGGRFVEGPDVEGHIRIAFHDEMDLAAAMHDPATTKIAHRIDQPAGCAGP